MPALNSESSGAEIESASEVSCEVAPTRPSKAAQTAPAAGGAAHVTQNYTRLHTLAGAIVVQAAQTAGEFPGTLTQQQGAAIELLLMGKSDRLVAETLGVCRKTVWNWRHANPAFKDEFHRRRKALWSGIVDRMRAMLDPSLDILAEQLSDSLDANRYRAALSILRLSNVRQAIPVREVVPNKIRPDSEE